VLSARWQSYRTTLRCAAHAASNSDAVDPKFAATRGASCLCQLELVAACRVDAQVGFEGEDHGCAWLRIDPDIRDLLLADLQQAENVRHGAGRCPS